MVQMNTPGSFVINELKVEEGRFNLEGYGGTDGDLTIYGLNQVEIGKDATLRMSMYGDHIPVRILGANDENSLNIHLDDGASIDFGGWKEDSVNNWQPERITIDAATININVENSNSGNYVYFAKPNANNAGAGLKTNPNDIHVIAASANNTGDAQSDLKSWLRL